jgi:hypothetical protein
MMRGADVEAVGAEMLEVFIMVLWRLSRSAAMNPSGGGEGHMANVSQRQDERHLRFAVPPALCSLGSLGHTNTQAQPRT